MQLKETMQQQAGGGGSASLATSPPQDIPAAFWGAVDKKRTIKAGALILLTAGL